MFKKIFYSTFVLGVLPTFIFAQTERPNMPRNFTDFVCIILNLLLDAIPLIVVLALIAFLAGLVKYVKEGDNEEQRAKGVQLMTFGILGFFFMVSVWGLVKIFVGSFGFDFGVPQFKSTDNGGSFFNSCK